MDANMDSPGKSSFLTGKLLSEGSFELLTYIQLFLDPVISMTPFMQKLCSKCCFFQTCKYLSGATRSRIVCMNAVQNVSIAQGVFLPSFPVEQMYHVTWQPGTCSSLSYIRKNGKWKYSVIARKFSEFPQITTIFPFWIFDLVPG